MIFAVNYTKICRILEFFPWVLRFFCPWVFLARSKKKAWDKHTTLFILKVEEYKESTDITVLYFAESAWLALFGFEIMIWANSSVLNSRPITFFTKSAWISLCRPDSLLTFWPYHYLAPWRYLILPGCSFCLDDYVLRLGKPGLLIGQVTSLNFGWLWSPDLWLIWAWMIIRSSLL